jgi:hypothetical protein
MFEWGSALDRECLESVGDVEHSLDIWSDTSQPEIAAASGRHLREFE